MGFDTEAGANEAPENVFPTVGEKTGSCEGAGLLPCRLRAHLQQRPGRAG